MKHEIKKIAVIGAGAMGSGIAAHAANAGYEVVLLDKRPEGAEQAVERMTKAHFKDAFNNGFMHPSNAKLIETGNTDDHMHMIADADLIVEAVFEDLEVKHRVFSDIYENAKKDAIITSNTSTIELEELIHPFPQDFKARFANTHFFNPPRYMRLLEIITGPDTDPDVLEALTDFCDRALGKKVVRAKDSPGFIANRIGIYAIERAHQEALKQGMKIEDVDAIMGPSFGFTHLGLFKLADEVGVDIVYHTGQSLHNALPANDEFHGIYTGADTLKAMIDAGYTGKHKGKGGFYAKENGPDGKEVKLARDLATGELREFEGSRWHKKTVWRKAKSESAFFDSDDPAAGFSWPVLRDMLVYTLNHALDIAYDIQSVDDAMRAGFNWKRGPFEMIDKFGLEWFRNKLKRDGIREPALLTLAENSFYKTRNGRLQVMDFDGQYVNVRREDGVLDLEDIKRKSKPLVTHNSASLWNIGDGVVCLEFHSIQNTIDPSILWVINESIKLVNDSEGKYKAMVVYNDGERFSIGANLQLVETFMQAAENKWVGKIASTGLKNLLHEMTYAGQAVYTALNQAPFPVIGAPKGQPMNMAFGGACEILLNCDALQVGAEQNMTLPELAVGLAPAWTGATNRLLRAYEKAERTGNVTQDPIIETVTALASPNPDMQDNSFALSAQDAREKLWLRPEDGVTMNPDRVLADAKAKALEMVPGYKPKPLPAFRLSGPWGKAMIRSKIDAMYLKGDDPKKGVNHVDVQVVDRLTHILTGGDTLEWEDVRRHATGNHAELEQLIEESPEGNLTINPSIELNYNRMMQLEREAIMQAFNDRANVWPRIRHMIAANNPLREQRPDPAPGPKELRAAMTRETLPRRDITGLPLTGLDEKKLGAMADMTTEFYKQFGCRTKTAHALQAPCTLLAIGRVMALTK